MLNIRKLRNIFRLVIFYEISKSVFFYLANAHSALELSKLQELSKQAEFQAKTKVGLKYYNVYIYIYISYIFHNHFLNIIFF